MREIRNQLLQYHWRKREISATSWEEARGSVFSWHAIQKREEKLLNSTRRLACKLIFPDYDCSDWPATWRERLNLYSGSWSYLGLPAMRNWKPLSVEKTAGPTIYSGWLQPGLPEEEEKQLYRRESLTTVENSERGREDEERNTSENDGREKLLSRNTTSS